MASGLNATSNIKIGSGYDSGDYASISSLTGASRDVYTLLLQCALAVMDHYSAQAAFLKSEVDANNTFSNTATNITATLNNYISTPSYSSASGDLDQAIKFLEQYNVVLTVPNSTTASTSQMGVQAYLDSLGGYVPTPNPSGGYYVVDANGVPMAVQMVDGKPVDASGNPTTDPTKMVTIARSGLSAGIGLSASQLLPIKNAASDQANNSSQITEKTNLYINNTSQGYSNATSMALNMIQSRNQTWAAMFR